MRSLSLFTQKDEIVCILQISTIEKCFAIDGLLLRKEISIYIKELFENPGIMKIFHGIDNDIKLLISNFNIFPLNVFDTGRAFMALQKYILNKELNSEMPSLKFLAKHFLELDIDKSYQKSDWRLRPLTKSNVPF